VTALRKAQQHALRVAPDPGPELRWEAEEDGSLVINLMRGRQLVAWIEPAAFGWRSLLVGSEYRGPNSHDPQVVMQALLDALKGKTERNLAQVELAFVKEQLASVKAERDAALAELDRVRSRCEIAEALLSALKETP
jgi:hypothetical protein